MRSKFIEYIIFIYTNFYLLDGCRGKSMKYLIETKPDL